MMSNRINKIIKILDEIKDSNILDIEANQSIERVLKKVNNLYKDKQVKVSILGEFSSGKSTFINGILEENILSYGDEPTTAINTVIKYGEKSSINVISESGEKKKINKNDIKFYIKEGERKRKCSTLEIINNNAYLRDGLVIIDTPGANINKHEHNLQRKKAIQESSVGVFLISSQSLTSNSFVNFLKENKNNLQKIIFVITKIDIYEEKISIDIDNKTPKEKLTSALEYVANVISEYGEFNQPKVYAISAKAFIEKRNLTIINVEKSFNEVVKGIREIAIKDKNSIIQYEIEKILDQIIGELNYLLQEKNMNYRKEIEVVNGRIQEFSTLIDSISKKFKISLNEEILLRKNEIRARVQENKKLCYNRIEERINGISSLSSFKDKANSIVNSEIMEFINNCNNFAEMELKKIGLVQFKCASEELKEYFSYIEKTYYHLGIQRRIKIKKGLISLIISVFFYFIINKLLDKGIVISLLTMIIVFIISCLFQRKTIKFSIPYNSYINDEKLVISNTKFVNNTGIDEGHVTGGGFLIGAVFGGPIGAIIGAGIGALVGSFFLGDQLKKVKKELLEVVEGSLVNQGNRIIKIINSNFSAKSEQLKISLENYIEDNKNLYTKLLNGMEEYNKGIFVKLTDTQKLSNKFIKELKRYQNKSKMLKFKK